MKRNLLAAGIALAAAHQAQAQNAKTIEMVASTALATEFAETATITVTSTAQMPDETEPSLSELSSRIGPFYETLMFMPGMNRGHFLSAIASGGNNDETTTFVGFERSFVTYEDWTSVRDSEDKTTLAYATLTWAPSTYIEAWTEYARETTASSVVMTTLCSHAYTEAKNPLPNYEWQTLDAYSSGIIVADQWPTVAAVCTIQGVHPFIGGETMLTTTLSLRDLNYGWKVLTVLGESPNAAAATVTSSGVDANATGAPAQAGSVSGTEGAKPTSTQAAGASEVTAWVNAVVVLAAGAAVMIV